MKKFLIVIASITLIVTIIVAIQVGRDIATPKPKKLSIVASFYPIGEFARQVGGNQIDLTIVTPNGVEPHDYEPTPQELLASEKADIFLFNGKGLDPWAEKEHTQRTTHSAKNKTDIRMTDHFTLISTEKSAQTPEGMNPHVWLDPQNAIKEVELIRDAFVAKDSTNKDFYEKNASAYITTLTQLDNSFISRLASCQKSTIVVTHDAFTYLASRYHFDTIAISGISPEDEPSAQRLSEIATSMREKKIEYIFFEPLASPKFAETIANEVGVRTLILNPIEGLSAQDQKNKNDYVSLMSLNLNNLTVALACTNH